MATHFETESTQSDFDVIKHKISDLLIHAGRNGGIVFGGYLRSLVGSNGLLPWKDVDLWFQTQEAADKFVTGAGDLLIGTGITEYNHPVGYHDYPFARRQFRLSGHDAPGAWVDLIISSDFPVDDFDVNMLRGHIDSHGTISITCPPEHDCETLKAKIIRQEAQLLPPYFHEIEEDFRQEDLRFRNNLSTRQHQGRRASRRVYERFIRNGWTVMDPAGSVLDPKYLKGPIREFNWQVELNRYLETKPHSALEATPELEVGAD